MLLRQAIAERNHLALRRGNGDAGLQPCHDRHEMTAAVCLIVGHRERHEDLKAPRQKLRRHDADDGSRGAVERNRLADDVRIAGETLAPEAVTEDRHRRPAGRVFIVSHPAAERRRHSQDAEQARRHTRRPNAFRRALFREH